MKVFIGGLVSLWALATVTFPAKAEPIFDLIRIEANQFGTNRGPEVTNSVAVAINNRGTVVGMFVNTNHMPSTFLWREGALTHLEAEYPTTARAMNNRDEVVGEMNVHQGDFVFSQAWLNSGRTNYLLGPAPPTTGQWGSSARSINDQGIIVGNLQDDSYVFASSEVRFPDLGGGPCWSGTSRLTLINNSGVVIGTTDEVPYLWPSLRSPEAAEYMSAITPTALNGSNVMAGTDWGRPVVLAGTNLTYLSAPGESGGVAAMNGAGTVVGQSFAWYGNSDDGTFPGWRPASGIIWSSSTGLDLERLVELPARARLVPNGINNAGMIAATLEIGDGRQAVVLKPRPGKALPNIAVSVPTEKTLHKTNALTVQATVRCGRPVTKITYTLYQRHQIPGGGSPPCWWTPPSVGSRPVATNLVNEAPFATTFTNLPSGQYAWEATVQDSAGAVAYSHRALCGDDRAGHAANTEKLAG